MTAIVKIIKNIPAPIDIWNEIYEGCEYATYFHSAAFSHIAKKAEPALNINSRLIEFNDDKRVIMLMHEQIAFKGLLKFNVSQSFSGYGGWISADKLCDEHVNLLLKYIISLNLYLRVNPFEPFNSYHTVNTNPDFSQILDLRKDYAGINRNYDYRHKYSIRKAQKAGVSFQSVSSEDYWREFYEVYLNSLKRWANNARQKREWIFWEALMNAQRNTNCIKLYVAKYDSKIVAGAVCLLDKRKVIYYHGAYLEEFKHVSPSTYLIDQIIQTSIGSYDYFDFMSSGKMENIILFKKGFAPAMVSSGTFFNQTLKYRVTDKILKALKDFQINLSI